MKFVFPIDGTSKRWPLGNLIQGYGENIELYKSVGLLHGHNGWDLIKFYGAPVYAAHDGKIEQTKFDPNGFGRHITVFSPLENNQSFLTIYGHLSEIDVVVGQEVKAGDPIGKMGNSGFVISGGVPYWGDSNPDKKGTHLHFGVKIFTLDPSGHNNIFGQVYSLLNANNGEFGWIDPAPYYGATNMSNAGIAQKENSPEFYGALPFTDPEALASFLLWIGKPVPRTPDGKVDFSQIITDYTLVPKQ